MTKMLLLRSYYGVNIHSDAHGDLGVFEFSSNRFADLVFLTAATIADQAKDIDVHVIDANAGMILPDDLITQLKSSYDYIILRVSSPIIKLDLELVKRLKALYPNCKLILVGHVAKLLKKWIYENVKEVDEVVEKPLDVYLYQFVNHVEEEVGINDFPCPDYQLVPYENFKEYDGGLRLSLQTSRGCIMRCGYCPYNAFYGDNISYRDTDKVIDDIKEILKFNPSVIQFRDQYFTANKKKVRELCNRILEENLQFKWSCETRLDNVDMDLLDLMVKSGLDMICFGVESGSDSILTDYGRSNVKFDVMKDLVSYLNLKKVKTLAFYIVGFPEDTWDTAQKTFETALYLNTTIAKFSVFEPCVFGEDNNLGFEVVPDLFNTYENTMNIEVGSKLSRSEATYLSDLFSLIYAYKNDSLEASYSVVYKNQMQYKELIGKLKKLGCDLDKISSFLKTHNYMC